MNLKIRELIAQIALKSKVLWYINGPQTLPPPLTEEEEQLVFEGLINNDKSARDKMIVHNLRLVIYIAKK